jgi:dolichol-phosphate mannosyltransferase
LASDLALLPPADWVIDAAANPSVLAGLDGSSSSRQLFEHNLIGMLNVLEYCKTSHAGLLLLSSSRVYSIRDLAAIPLREEREAFRLDTTRILANGLSEHGINSAFSTEPPISLYGSTKLASETVALEYGAAFGFPVWITRCGVLAGAGQFGTADQGIFAYWINTHLRRKALRFLNFGGTGHQVRDAFHPRDLADLLLRQIRRERTDGRRIYTAGGGPGNAISLAQLTPWCDDRFGPHVPQRDPSSRPFDIPWMVMDNREARENLGWSPASTLESICEEIALHAEKESRVAPTQRRKIDVPLAVNEPLHLLSIVIPARDEEGRIESTVEHLHTELRLRSIAHEIVVVNDGSTDRTQELLEKLCERVPVLKPVHNTGQHGFGRAITLGFDHSGGDAIVVMMADEFDDYRDVVVYWETLNQGWHAVFGSRFLRGGGVIDYPWIKLAINRVANLFLRLLFGIRLNDTTNAFKAYRRTVIDACRPFLSPHFNLTIELPLKTIIRGFSWTVVPITWRNRKKGISKLKIKEMGSRYLFIALYCWLEKYFSRGDYRLK